MTPGFRTKVYAGFFVLLIIQGMVFFVWFSQTMKQTLLTTIKTHAVSIGTHLSARMVEPLLAMDFLRMRVLVDETVTLEPDIYYAFVLDRRGEPLIHSFKTGFPTALKQVNAVSDHSEGSIQLLDTGKERIYDYAVPITINGDRLGTLRVGFFHTRAGRVVNSIMLSAVVTLFLTVVMAGVVGTLLLDPVMQRIQKLQESSEQALRGNLDVKTAPMLKENCWDIMQCRREACPAYKNHHHRCWYLAGTLCPTCVEGTYARKIDSCRKCRVYRKCSGDEVQSLAESFDAMTLSLKGHLSDLKTAERVVNEQKVRLQTILDAIPDFITLQDSAGRYVSVNRAFCKMLNRPSATIVGKVNQDLFPGELARMYDREDRGILETGKTLIKENRIVRRGKITWLHLVKVGVLNADRQAAGIVCSGRDITRLKNVQDQLTQAQKMESVGRLAAGVAHEINTPLGIILGYAQLLLEDVDKESVLHDDVAVIVKQTRICAKIVADLLSFSRTGERVITRFDLNGAVEEVLDVVEHTFGLNHVSVERIYDHPILWMNGDKEKIKQVCINLLNNAFDAIDKKGSICVHTRLGKTPKEIVFSIRDTGHGITRKNLKKLFEPFFTTKGPDKGTGLGLSVSFGIIKEHGGTIEVFSPPMPRGNSSREKILTGTEFIVTLPTELNETGKEG